MKKILPGIVIWISLGCLSANAQPSPHLTVNSKTITILYGTKASGMEGKVARKNGDFLRFEGVSKLEWKIDVPSAGSYSVNISYGCKKARNDDRIEISAGKKLIKYSVTQTAGVWGEGSFERIAIDETLYLEKGAQVLSMVVPGKDQEFDFRNLELIPVLARSLIQAGEKRARDSRAKSDWLAKSGYGLMFHWTSESINPDGKIKPFQQAVNDFDLNAFVKMVEETGAGYVLFTVGHAEPYCPAPIKSWEKYHPGHTTKRDLVMEMADQLNAKGIKLMCYFPTHVVGKYKKVDEQEFTQINRDIMTEFGKRYQHKVAGYWFDGWYQCFEEYPGFSFKDFFMTCKAGYPERIIALNSWIYPAVTEWQEYWAGEAASPVEPPVNGTLERGPGKGLRYQSLIIMEPYWVQQKAEMPAPRFSDEELCNYIRKCNAQGGAVTINLGIYQNGKIGDKALQVMKKVKARLRHGDQRSQTEELYPTATKYSAVCYAEDVNNKPLHARILAGHFQTDSILDVSWIKQVDYEGNYEVILSYSANRPGASVSITAGGETINDSLPVTSGVYIESKEWYNFNCERRLLSKSMALSKGMNKIMLKLSPGAEKTNMVLYSLEFVPVDKKSEALQDIKNAFKSRPTIDWFSSMKYGVMFHWTAQAAPKEGPVKSYKERVKEFDVKKFVDMVEKTGAQYVIFTGNHADPHFPGPLSNWEKEFPGQTTKRDLLMELATALKEKNIRFILYLATHVYAKQDKVDDAEFDRLNSELISEIGNHYGNKIDGYWLDGFYQSYKTHPSFDFKKFYQVSKAGNPDRLLALNSWLYPVVTQWQDFWAGEVYTPSTLPDNRIIAHGPGKGLPFHSLVVLENDWVHDKVNAKIPSPRLKSEQLIEYINSCEGKGPVTINLGIYQDGTIGDEAMVEMQKIKKAIN